MTSELIAGFISGLLVWVISLVRDCILLRQDKKKIYDFLKNKNKSNRMRSAKAIAIETRLTAERVINVAYKDDRLEKDLYDNAELIGIKNSK